MQRLLRLTNPEIALGFVIASIFWIGVLGWQAAYAPSEIEKRQCEEAAHKGGFKGEECKTIWERTTTDPVAFFTFWLSVSTIGLWIVTANAARDGKRAANIAEAALVKLERAFVSFSFNAAGGIDSAAPNVMATWRINPVWKNSGKTPTRGLHTHVSWDHFPTELPDTFTFPDIFDAAIVARVNPGTYIGPLDSISGDAVSIESCVMDAARQGHLHIYIWGWVEYDDVFESTPPHRTEFCNHIMVFGDPYAVNQPAPCFALATHNTHTGADEDCYRQARPRGLRSQPIT